MDALDTLSREQLIQIILDQHRMIEQLRAEPPGRKPGQGHFRFRGAPEVAEGAGGAETIAVPVDAPCCPDCGGELSALKRELVSITDVPAQPQPEVRRYAAEVRDCRACGRKIRGRHPDIAPGQHGAAAHRVGARVRAMAHALHYLHGVPVRRTPAILKELTGVRLTQGAITQDAMKQAEGTVGLFSGRCGHRFRNSL